MSRAAAIAAATAVLLGAVACGGASPSPPVASGTSAPKSAMSASSATSAGSSTPSDPVSSSPSATPAVGRTYDLADLTLTLPASFTPAGSVGKDSGIVSNASFQDRAGGVVIYVSALGNFAGYTFDQAAELKTDNSAAGSRQPDREVGGEQVYVFDDATSNAFTRKYAVGRAAGGAILEISIQLVRGLAGQDPVDPAADQALIESILATVEWKA